MPLKPRIPITADGKKEPRVFDTELALQRVMINEEPAAEAFQYELSGFQPTLFHNGHMRELQSTSFRTTSVTPGVKARLLRITHSLNRTP